MNLGYSETPYLTDGYLLGTQIAYSGFQANIVNVKTATFPNQATIQIDGVKSTAPFQSTATLNSSAQSGFQAVIYQTSLNASGIQASLAVQNVFKFTAMSAGITQLMHYPQSYLMGPYLETPYLDFVTGQLAFPNFQANIVAQKETATGFQANIIQDRMSAFAWQASTTVTKEQAFGFQANVLQIRGAVVPFQADLRLIKTRATGFQARTTVTKAQSFGFQASIYSNLSVGFQGRVVIYNTTNLRILTDFPSRGVNGLSWTCASVASGDYGPNNLNTDLVEQVFRTAPGGVNIELFCDTQISQGIFVDTFAMLNHNLSGSASVLFDGSNTNTFDTALTVAIPLDRSNNAYWIAPTVALSNFRYWRLRINDVANPDGFIEIGTIVFGSAVIFSGDNFTDNVRLGRKQFADSVFTEGFTNVKNNRGQKKSISFDFKNLNFDRGAYKNLSTIIETQSTLFKSLWIPTPKYPSRFAVFGKLTELPQETHNDKGENADYVDVSLNVDEAE